MMTGNRLRKIAIFAGFGALLLLWATVPSDPVFAHPAISTESNIVFAVHDGYTLKMDLAYPNDSARARPVLVYISGSGWGHWWGPSFDQHEYDTAILDAALHGYVAATVGYRPTSIKVDGKSKYHYPDQFIDVRSAVQAAVSIAGTTEMTRMYQEATYPGMQGVISDLMGGTSQQLPGAYRAASPIYYANRNAPPILMIQGDVDTEVPPDQATMLQKKLQKLGAHPKLIILKSVGHWNDYFDPAILPFFDSVLKGN